MPFANTQSITATDLNNTLRGFHRDFTDNSHTGDTNETTMGSVSVTGGTMTGTGSLYFFACGTITDSGGGTKRIRVDFGGTDILDTTATSGTADWFVEGWIMNTSTSAQRIFTRFSDNANATNFSMDYSTAAIDTTANVTLAVTVELADGTDTVTMTIFKVDVQQIT